MTATTNNPKFMRYRFPPQAGGGDLVIRGLLAGEVDKILELENTRPIDIVAELAVEATHAINGETMAKGNPGLAWFRALPNQRREFLLSAYNAVHNTSAKETKALKASIEFVENAVRFTVPGTKQKDPATGLVIPDSGQRFEMRELLAGEIDDTLRAATDGLSAVTVTAMLVVASLQSFDGAPTPKGAAGVKWLREQSNKLRTVIAEAYSFLHRASEDDTQAFLAGAEPLEAPPKSI